MKVRYFLVGAENWTTRLNTVQHVNYTHTCGSALKREKLG